MERRVALQEATQERVGRRRRRRGGGSKFPSRRGTRRWSTRLCHAGVVWCGVVRISSYQHRLYGCVAAFVKSPSRSRGSEAVFSGPAQFEDIYDADSSRQTMGKTATKNVKIESSV